MKHFKPLLFTLIFIIAFPIVSFTQGSQFYIIEKVSNPNNPHIWESDGYLVIEDSIATFIFRYRNKIDGIYGEIDGYNIENNIQKFYIRGRGFSSGNIMSFIITKTEDIVIIRAFKKLSGGYDLYFKCHEIDIH